MTKRPKSEVRSSKSQVVGPPAAWALAATGEEIVLAIDTSTQAGGVALCRGRHVLGEDTWQAGTHQTAQVLPAAQRLWQRAGLAAGDVRLVVVATGPGSFTGLRAGMSLGKGLALALGIPLVGVPTLDALAYQQTAAGATPTRLIAVVAAGRGHFYAGTYGIVRGQLRREHGFAVWNGDELRATTRGARRDTIVCGEIDVSDVALPGQPSRAGVRGRSEQAEPASDGTPVAVASPAAGVRRAAYLAELGRWVFATEGAPEAALLQPIYLRRSPGLGDAGHVQPPA